MRHFEHSQWREIRPASFGAHRPLDPDADLAVTHFYRADVIVEPGPGEFAPPQCRRHETCRAEERSPQHGGQSRASDHEREPFPPPERIAYGRRNNLVSRRLMGGRAVKQHFGD